MLPIRNWLLAVTLASLGCDSVTITEPFGAPVAPEQLKTVIGRWSDEESNLIELRLSKTNELVGGHLTWDEETQRFVSKSDKLDIRTAENVNYIFYTEDKESSFVRVELIGDGHINFYLPYPDSFRNAVNSGSLNGIVTTKENGHFHVKITADAKFQEVLASDNWRHYYYPDLVVKYKRIPLAK